MRYEVVSVHDLEPPHGTCSVEENEDGYNCSHKCLAEGLEHLCGCTDFTKGTQQYSTVKYKVVKVLLGAASGMLEHDRKRERETVRGCKSNVLPSPLPVSANNLNEFNFNKV